MARSTAITAEPGARPSVAGSRKRGPAGVRGAPAEEFVYHLHRGSELLIGGDDVGAKEELERALSLQPLDPQSEDLLGVVYFRLGLYERAMAIYEKLTREHPDAPTLHVNLALGYLKTGQLKRARVSLERAIELNPEHVRAHAYRGLVLSRLGEYELARDAFDRGGHPVMARRMERLAQQAAGGRVDPEQIARDEARRRDLRRFAESAFQELDAVDNPFRVELGVTRTPARGEWQRLGPDAPPSPARVSEPPPPPAPSRASEEAPAPVGLAEGLRAAALPFPEMAPFAVDADGTLRVRVAGTVLCRLQGLRVMVGELRTEPIARRMRGRSVEGLLGPEHAPLVRVSGEGGLVLCPDGEAFEPFRIEDDPVYLREELLVAVDGNVTWENGRLPAGSDSVALVNLRGRGDFVLSTRAAWHAVAVTRGTPAMVALDALLGWSGRLLPGGAVPTDGGLPADLIRFQGEGILLVSG